MSEVAMVVPVLSSLVDTYKDLDITLVTNEKYVPMFEKMPNIEIFPIEILTRHSGKRGVFRLYHDLQELPKFDVIIDLQGKFRNKFLCFLFRILKGTHSYHVDMGMREKRRQVRPFMKKVTSSLESIYSRYVDVFTKVGFIFPLNFESIYPEKPTLSIEQSMLTGEKTGKWIGIAPFTKHTGKMLPLKKMERVIDQLSIIPDVKIFLFCADNSVEEQFESWEKKYKNVVSLANKINLRDELRILANMDVMISMDSVSLHLASIVKTPTISIWGSTHRYSMGTVGWNQSRENVIEVPLKCRPCSLTGDDLCRRGDYACLNEISVEQIVTQTKKLLDKTIK